MMTDTHKLRKPTTVITKIKRRPRSGIRIESLLKASVVLLALGIGFGNLLLFGAFHSLSLDYSSSPSSALSISASSSSSSTGALHKTPQENFHINTEVDRQDNDNDNDDDDYNLRKILLAANVNVSEYSTSSLPTWEEATTKFGSKPILHGLDTCQVYKDSVALKDRYVGPAGTFNSGTNLLAQTLMANCQLRMNKRGKQDGIEWQVNWGKHQPPRFRLENKLNPNIPNENMFPIVIIRDPWSWMQSMCRVRYSAHWYHVVPPDDHPNYEMHCPNLIANAIDRKYYDKAKPWLRQYYNGDPWQIDNMADKANYTLDKTVVPLWVRYKSRNVHHASLIHMWRDWYSEYYDVDFPRLIIRLEDLVFHPNSTLQQICDCVGGDFLPSTQPNKELTLVAESAKGGSEGEHIHGKNQSNLLSAMISHLRSNRTKGMTDDDLQFVKSTLHHFHDTIGDSPIAKDDVLPSNIDLTKAFGYSDPCCSLIALD